MTDALNVVMATIPDCPMTVSWNFRHIVHFHKLLLYDAVNKTHGYCRKPEAPLVAGRELTAGGTPWPT